VVRGQLGHERVETARQADHQRRTAVATVDPTD
jgi:hypothetical protein